MISSGRTPELRNLFKGITNGSVSTSSAITDVSNIPQALPYSDIRSSDEPEVKSNIVSPVVTEYFASPTIPVLQNNGFLAQASTIWTQSTIGEDGLHFYEPSTFIYARGSQDFSGSMFSLPRKSGFPSTTSTFLHKTETSLQCSGDINPSSDLSDVPHSSHQDVYVGKMNEPEGNARNLTLPPHYTPSNRLRHFSLPCFASQEQNLSFSEEMTRDFPVITPLSNGETVSQVELNHFSSSPGVHNYRHPVNSASVGDVCRQLCFYPDRHQTNSQNLFPPNPFPASTVVEQHTQDNPGSLPSFQEIHVSNMETASMNMVSPGVPNLRQPPDVCARAKQCDWQPDVLNSCMISENSCAETLEFTRIFPAPKSSDNPANRSVEEPSKKASNLHNQKFETCVPEFNENHLTRAEGRQMAMVKEASLSERVKAQVDDFINFSGKKKKNHAVKKWKCTVCGRALARASTLKTHMRLHSGDRPFKCPCCPKSFVQSALLRSHFLTHSGERPFSCPTCRKTFTHSSALKTHQRTHTGERPHKCPVSGCGQAFSDSSTLAKHSRVHSGERPYMCNLCDKRFTQSGNMHKHRKSVHKVSSGSSCNKSRLSRDSKTLA